MKMMLAIAGVEMPDYSYRISDLVTLERKAPLRYDVYSRTGNPR